MFWHFTEFKRNWDFTKVNKSYDIPQYFLSQISHFCSVLSNNEVLLTFRDFVPWQMKFFCLLLNHFTFRRHQQIFCHRQMKGDFFNIADTYVLFLLQPSRPMLSRPNPTSPSLPWPPPRLTPRAVWNSQTCPKGHGRTSHGLNEPISILIVIYVCNVIS